MRTFEDFRRDGDSTTWRDVPPVRWTRRPGEMAIWRGNKSRSKLRAPPGDCRESKTATGGIRIWFRWAFCTYNIRVDPYPFLFLD